MNPPAADLTALSEARKALRPLYRRAEPGLLRALTPDARPSAGEGAPIRARAESLIAELRGSRHVGWIDRFLPEDGLNTDEGIAPLGLAEAYLRGPDAFTPD